MYFLKRKYNYQVYSDWSCCKLLLVGRKHLGNCSYLQHRHFDYLSLCAVQQIQNYSVSSEELGEPCTRKAVFLKISSNNGFSFIFLSAFPSCTFIWGVAGPPHHMACEEIKDSLLYRKTHFLFQVQFPFFLFCWHADSLCYFFHDCVESLKWNDKEKIDP